MWHLLLILLGLAPNEAFRPLGSLDTLGGTSRSKNPANIKASLPDALSPSTYRLRLLPLFDDPLAEVPVRGRVEIDVLCRVPTATLTVHARDLTVDGFAVVDGLGSEVVVTDDSFDSVAETLTLTLASELTEGETYTVTFDFHNVLRTDLEGFYKLTYEENGSTKALAVTHFEPAFARRAFPCFDEPRWKARFQLTLGRREAWMAVGNMPSLGTEPIEDQPGYVWETFDATPLMSPYLLCFAVSEFGRRFSAGSTIPVSVLARPDIIGNADLALETAPAVLENFGELFGIPYELPKMDLIAVSQLWFGAMENWGLNTYLERALLADPQREPVETIYTIVFIICHEFAHQWFGNLVTTQEWGTVWLNEGFASYLEYVMGEILEPNWSWSQSQVVRELHEALFIDSRAPSRSMTFDAQTLDDFVQMFDGITYSKGSIVLRMMVHFLGEETAFKAFKAYLNGERYGSVTPTILFSYLDAAASEDGTNLGGNTVDAILSTWTLQPGYPLVSARVDGRVLSLDQRHYIADPGISPDPDRLWMIPVAIATESSGFEETQPKFWMSQRELSIDLGDIPAGPDEWFIISPQATGLFRVKYEDAIYERIVDTLATDHQRIHILNRAQLIDDAFELADTDDISYDIPLALTQYLGSEDGYAPWARALNQRNRRSSSLEYVFRMLETDVAEVLIRDHLLSLVSPQLRPFETLAQVPDHYDDVTVWMKNKLIQDWACELGNPACRDSASALFRQWMTDFDASEPDTPLLSPNAKSTVVCNGVRGGSDAEWNFVFDYYLAATVSAEKSMALTALACTRDSTLLAGYLNRLLQDDIRAQDIGTAFSAIALNPTGRNPALNFLRDSWDPLKTKAGSMESLIRGFRLLNTPAELSFLSALRDAHPADAGAFQATIVAVEWNVDWMDKHSFDVVAWLENNSFVVR